MVNNVRFFLIRFLTFVCAMEPRGEDVKNNEKRHHYKETFNEFVLNSSLAGFLHLGAKHWVERYIWYIIHIFSLGCTLYLINYSWTNFMTNPIVTTVEAMGSLDIDVQMPGISICNINKISRRKAEAYAQNLSQKSGVPRDEILRNISLLGYLYEYNLPPNPDQVIYFQNFLEKYDSAKNGYFNTSERLYQIQPTCNEVVKNCKWQGKKNTCSDIFVTELTMDGYCCVFNYISQRSTTRISPIIAENHYKPVVFRSRNILDFHIETNTSDTFFTTVATEAPVKILISLPTDFPDTTSGGLTEIIIDKGTEVTLQISAVATVTSSEVKKYSLNKRKCLFRDEAETMFGSYSYSDCIMDCKIKSIVALCQCIPYNFINVFENKNHQYFQCTLADLSCLNSYSNKWKTQFPTGYDGPGLEREKQDSIQCGVCVPACSDTMYEVASDDTSILMNGTRTNFSVVHITYEKSIGAYNKQDVFYYWYDMISMFGGLCSITMGLSFISIFEIIYYCTWVIIKKNLTGLKIFSYKKPRANT